MTIRRSSALIAFFAGFFAFAATLSGYDVLTTYVGAATCKTCHKAEYASWEKTRHSQAVSALPEKERENRVCLDCHSLGTEPGLASVQCESCHGAGGQYGYDYVMKDKKLSAAVGLVALPGDEVCFKCHSAASTRLKAFDPITASAKISHGVKKKAVADPTEPTRKKK